ncbi:hypothetical protein HY622_03100 [Candidatus Uhrbacteria bacterium]|nr:hypothetical protein [Candidatus Uhrbacteria bacterium]
MSPSFIQIKHRFHTVRCVKEKKVDSASKKIYRINLALILTISAIGVWYLAQINSLATKGYTIKNLEKEIAEQVKERERLEVVIAKESSIAALQQRMNALHLVPSNAIVYLEPQKSVAVAR